MRNAAAKGRKLLFLAAVLALSSAFLTTIPAEAARSYSPPLTAALEPDLLKPSFDLADVENIDAAGERFALFTTDDLSLLAALALLDASELDAINAENRVRLFGDSGRLPRPVAAAVARKTASGDFDCGLVINVRETGGLGRECVGPSFQGLWHDPVTGLAYARNRWYDPRTAHWLSPDPMGPVDSPNLYAFAGWAPHMYRDPMGTCIGADWECWGWVAQDFYVNVNHRPVQNAQRAAGGAVGFGKFVGETAYDLGLLTADAFLMRAPGLNLGQSERMAQRGEGIGQLLSNPGGAIKGSFTRMADNVLAHEQAGEYFQSGMVAGEYGSAAGAVVVGGFEAGVGVARLARVGVSSARNFSLNLGRRFGSGASGRVVPSTMRFRTTIENYTGKWQGWGKGFGDTGRYSWRQARRRLLNDGFVEPYQAAHHWAIPRGGSGRLSVNGFFREQWGRYIPNVVKNQRWNLMPARSNTWHHAVHGKGPLAYNLPLRLWHGSPVWAKAAFGGGAAASSYGAYEVLNGY